MMRSTNYVHRLNYCTPKSNQTDSLGFITNKQELVYISLKLHERQNIPLIKCEDIIGLTHTVA